MKHHTSQELDEMLAVVIGQARNAGIPIPKNINSKVLINQRAKSRLGCCKRGKNGKFEIEVSSFVTTGEANAIYTVLAHEVLHTCPGCMNHGQTWKRYGTVMEDTYGYRISRLASRKELKLPDDMKKTNFRYVLTCKACGRKTFRQRMSPVVKRPDLYRCSCGGGLNLTILNQQKNIGRI